MARECLLVRKRRRKAPRTTDSRGWFKHYSNLITDYEPLESNKLWVSDITYIPLNKGFLYLSLITDAYSHQIVGWDLSDTLHLEGALYALKKALATCKPITGLIHHSDRGSQYRSYEYVKLLQDYGVEISMTQTGDPKENAVAERINGIIKNEMLEGKTYQNIKTATKEIETAINIYNTQRPHSSCQMLTPDKAALQKGHLIKIWKKKIHT